MTTPVDVTDVLRTRFARANELYLDLVGSLSAAHLGARLAETPSNTIGGQLWCVLGARESYPRAARAGGWQGFTSPVTAAQATDPVVLRGALETTAQGVADWLGALHSEDDWRYAFALLEHETQHHGQLIRYLYGNAIPRPASWQRQYALDQDF
jgi:hypothetical protein